MESSLNALYKGCANAWALLIKILLKIFESLEAEWADPLSNHLGLAMEGAFYVVVHCCVL
jgi:hypothetical protein